MPNFVGFVGPAYQAASIYQEDQESINWYCEGDPEKFGGAQATGQPEERGAQALYPTPGLVLQSAGSATQIAPVRALWTQSGGAAMLGVVGSSLYSYDATFSPTFAGNLLSNTGPVSMVDNGVDAYLVDGANRYTYSMSSGAFAVIGAADGAFQGGTKVDILDNFLVYNKPGTQLFGNTNAGTTVSGNLNFSAKDGSSDNLVSLIVYNRDLILLGERTCETWTDAGTFPAPFTRLSGASMQHGIVAPFSVARLGETAAWLSKDDRGQGVVMRLVGYQPARISTHAVETAISRYSTITDATAYSYQQGGHEFYVLNFPTADATWCFDLATELWHKRAWRDSNNVYHRHRSNCAALFQGQVIVGDWQNGNIYALSQSAYTDAGDPLPCVRRCPHMTSDLKHQFFHDIQIQFQPGVGLQSGQGSNPQAMLEWSDDGGSTWSNQHWASIGKVGKYKNRAIWRRLGTARDRIFQVTVTDPVYRVIVSAEINASAGAH